MTSLVVLFLGNTQVDGSLDNLKTLTCLQEADLRYTGVSGELSDSNLQGLPKLRALRSLTVSGSRVTNWSEPAALTHWFHYWHSGCDIDVRPPGH